MNRRQFLGLAGSCALWLVPVIGAGETPQAAPGDLRSAPLQLSGTWGASPVDAAARVLRRSRDVYLRGLRLVSDRQPSQIRVDNHADGPPAIWLHSDPPDTAWIIVDVGGRDWCKLAYQFGHELGHVLCNSWDITAKPRPPSQWLEEALVEAFSIRGLGELAASWETDPPFAGDAAFSQAIRQYRANAIQAYRNSPMPAAQDDYAAWFSARRGWLDGGLAHIEGPAVLAVLPLLEEDKACIEDLGAVNRWQARSGLKVEDYMAAWQASCRELGAPNLLPSRVGKVFGIG